jgi:hypothetical protein
MYAPHGVFLDEELEDTGAIDVHRVYVRPDRILSVKRWAVSAQYLRAGVANTSS